MEWSELKPLARALVLPPGLLVLLLLVGLLLMLRRQRLWRGLGGTLLLLNTLGLWLLSCTGFALWLHAALLPTHAPAQGPRLAAQGVQAIVVLGGGVNPQAPEYGAAQLGEASWQRLRLGVHLARQSGLPLAVAGGVGWAAIGTGAPAEATLADQALRQWFGLQARWLDTRSRDTRENAREMAALLRRDGVSHIALVTHDWHMARAVRDFRDAGLNVLPAPTGYVEVSERPALRWLPSAQGLWLSSLAWREWLGLRLT